MQRLRSTQTPCSNQTRGQRGYTPPKRVDPRSVEAAPASGLFTASASSSARGATTAEEQAIYNQAMRRDERWTTTSKPVTLEQARHTTRCHSDHTGCRELQDQLNHENHHGKELGKKEGNNHARDSHRKF